MSMLNGGRCDMCDAPGELCDCIGMMMSMPIRTPEEEAEMVLEAEQMGCAMARHFYQELADLLEQPDDS